MKLTRTEITAWIVMAFLMAMCGLAAAGPAEQIAIAAARAKWALSMRKELPDKPPNINLRNFQGQGATEKSDLHSHLCSKCNHEWWHDPTKGPVSHNCPKCGRQQFVVNRTSPAGSRSTPLAAGLPSQQVGREPVSKQRTVYVVGSTACYPCQLFKQKHGDGTTELKYIYCYMNQPKPPSFDVATWNELVRHNNSGRFVYPFFVIEMDGEFVALQAKVE